MVMQASNTTISADSDPETPSPSHGSDSIYMKYFQLPKIGIKTRRTVDPSPGLIRDVNATVNDVVAVGYA